MLRGVTGTEQPAIVPRWEWRTFGDDLDDAERRFAELEPTRQQESEETYLLSSESDASVKVRAGLMDVKRLEAVDADGLEQWRPVLKGEFPLPAEQVTWLVEEALGTRAPRLARETYSLEELLDDVVGPSPSLQAVAVEKRRKHFPVGTAMAELTELVAGGRSTRTIAVESEDPTAVVAAVAELGLSGRPNTNMSAGLKELVGPGGERYAVIDVGTNSVKLHVAERSPGGWKRILDRSEVTRLGEGLEETGSLGVEPIARTVEAIVGMAGEARGLGAREIAAVGTAGMRIAANSSELIDAVEARAGIRIEVISGEEEGRLAYVAARAGLGLGDERAVVFDTGGGSSQFTFGRGGEVDERFSVNVGAVRFTEAFGLAGPVSEEVLEQALGAIGADLDRLDGRPRPALVVALGGAVTNLAAVKHSLATYDPDVVQGTVLDLVEIDRQLELYRTRTAEERREIVGLQPARAEVILAGTCIVRSVLGKLGSDSLTVSDRGLRHGVLVDRFGSGTTA
jgi:exopolyphosphatase / guanosine-5'-triphosphate,3'-diphosphate pyrophosphatase